MYKVTTFKVCLLSLFITFFSLLIPPSYSLYLSIKLSVLLSLLKSRDIYLFTNSNAIHFIRVVKTKKFDELCLRGTLKLVSLNLKVNKEYFHNR